MTLMILLMMMEVINDRHDNSQHDPFGEFLNKSLFQSALNLNGDLTGEVQLKNRLSNLSRNIPIASISTRRPHPQVLPAPLEMVLTIPVGRFSFAMMIFLATFSLSAASKTILSGLGPCITGHLPACLFGRNVVSEFVVWFYWSSITL